MKTYLNQQNLADKLGVTVTTVKNWRRKGCPFKKDGHSVFFDTSTVMNWREDYEKNKLQNSPEYASARARLEQAKAGIAELEFKEKAGELIAKKQVQKEAEDLYRGYRDKMLNVVIRATKKLLGETNEFKFRQVLKGEIEAATKRTYISINGQKL